MLSSSLSLNENSLLRKGLRPAFAKGLRSSRFCPNPPRLPPKGRRSPPPKPLRSPPKLLLSPPKLRSPDSEFLSALYPGRSQFLRCPILPRFPPNERRSPPKFLRSPSPKLLRSPPKLLLSPPKPCSPDSEFLSALYPGRSKFLRCPNPPRFPPNERRSPPKFLRSPSPKLLRSPLKLLLSPPKLRSLDSEFLSALYPGRSKFLRCPKPPRLPPNERRSPPPKLLRSPSP